jgi:ubiquinone/menaquinone biosynthesis C-methylase UbiE
MELLTVKQTYYDSISLGYNKLHKEEQLKKLKIILDYFPRVESVLDVGAGTGFCLDFIKAKRKVALDPSEGMLKQCKYEKVVGCAESLPFKDNEFDAIISLTALHHCSDINKALDEINRVAKHFIAISILRKAKNFDLIEKAILKKFKNCKEIKEEKDIIFLFTKH